MNQAKSILGGALNPKEKEIEDLPGPGAYDPHLGYMGPTADDMLKELKRRIKPEEEKEPKLKIGPQTYRPNHVNHKRGYSVKLIDNIPVNVPD